MRFVFGNYCHLEDYRNCYACTLCMLFAITIEFLIRHVYAMVRGGCGDVDVDVGDDGDAVMVAVLVMSC